jgi:hypothetical protein
MSLVVLAMFTNLMVLREGGMKASWEDISRTLAICSPKLWRTVILLLQLFTDYSQQPLLWKKRDKREEAVAATRSIAQSAKEILLGDMGSAIIDANSEGSSFGLSPSGFALLAMQGLSFDVGMNETDLWVLPDSCSSILDLSFLELHGFIFEQSVSLNPGIP